jgi:parallel beta-helix repeat protein
LLNISSSFARLTVTELLKHMFFRAIVISLLTAASALQAAAATLYVSPMGRQVAPYTNWTTAAHVIQDAVDAATNGDEIVVTNGVYTTGGRPFGTNVVVNRVAAEKPLVLRSVNGPQFTVIDGQRNVRCVALASNAILSGFTVTNGLVNGNGGGVWCESDTAIISNCTLTGNLAPGNAGGGAYGGTLNNCTLTGNSSSYGGGACYGMLNTCTVSGNSANYGGGTYAGTLNNCKLTDNSAANGGGAYYGSLSNSTLNGNSASTGGGGTYATLNNCTLTGNSASFGGGIYGGTLRNCIVYYNTGPGGNYDASSTLNYCCTTPLPANGTNNLSAEPQLASRWHLSANSPCIGKGSYASASGVDIDGELWNNPPSIGCDEYWSGSVTGSLQAAFAVSYTNVAVGFSASVESLISGLVSASSWDFGDGVVVSNRPYASHAWAAAGDYLVVLRVYNEEYPQGVSATVNVHVVPQPVHYVALSGSSPSAPYSSWAAAANKIQDAVDAATVPGALVLVSNGVYQIGSRAVYGMSNRVAVTRPLMVQSVNGASVTRIAGYQVPGKTNGAAAVRCVYLTNGAVLAGFTLTNGATQSSGDQYRQMSGGAVYCEWGGAVVSNCVLAGNSAYYRGGGAYFGTLHNCTLSGNSASSGGGIYLGTLYNCTLTGNAASFGGGAYYGTLHSCTMSGNSASSGGGTYSSTLHNCTLSGNSVSAYSSYGGGVYNCTLHNCTLTGNSASGSWAYAGGAYSGTLNNCILYFNTGSSGANYDPAAHSVLNYCCTMPLPTNGVGNVDADPLFVAYAGGNLRLQSNSPCINGGNNAYVSDPTDLDHNPRIISGTVDMGAYEFQGTGSAISQAWLQQYGLPSDGSADYADADSDGMNNWQEWVAATNPTNALSVLRITSATKAENPAGLVVTWDSVNTRTYHIESSTNLAAQPPFFTLQSSILGQAGTTSYTDTNAVGPGPFFYRVGINSP